MKRSLSFLGWIPVGIAGLLLIFNAPTLEAVASYAGWMIVYALLTAVVLQFGQTLASRDLSAAYGVGMLALLSQPADAAPVMLWATAVGGLLAAVRWRGARSLGRLALHRAARLVISFAAGWLAYTTAGGQLPLALASARDLAPLLLGIAAHSAAYFALFAFESAGFDGRARVDLSDARPHARTGSSLLASLLLVVIAPAPLALLGVEVFANLSAFASITFLIAFSLLLSAPYLFGVMLNDRQNLRAARLAALNDILAQLTGSLSLEAILDETLAAAARLGETETLAIMLMTEDALPRFTAVRSQGLSQQFLETMPTPRVLKSPPRSAPEGDAPLIVADLGDDALAAQGIAASVELPLTVAGVRLGAIVLYYERERVFDAEWLDLLSVFANQAAQGISNARLYAITDETLERRVGQLLALAAIGHELTATIDLDRIGDLVLDHALDAMQTQVGAFILLSKTGEVELFTARGYPPSTTENKALAFEGVTGRALREGRALVLNEVNSDPTYRALLPGMSAQLSVPVMRGDTLCGVITLEDGRGRRFSEDDVQFVTQLANQAVIAIENARLFQNMAETRDRLQVLLNTMREAILLIDNSGAIALANPRVGMLGIAPETLTGRTLDALLDDETLELAQRLGFRSEHELRRLVRGLKNAARLNQDGRADGDLAFIPPAEQLLAGERHLLRQIIPVRDNADRPIGAMLIYYDQTEQHKLAQTREDLSRMIVHDLRSPLTAVMASLKLLADLAPKDSALAPMIEMTTDAGRRAIRKLLSRVDSLLDVSRIESGFVELETRATELATLVDSVCVELSPLAHELDIAIEAAIPADLPLLLIDAEKVERVLLNLLDNALKFAPMASTVLLRAQLLPDAPPRVRIEVIDNGPGIPDEHKTRLFDRYVQMEGRKGKRRGSGLGLTFCRLIVEAHGGRIWVEDNPHGGSIFVFTLPAANEG